MKVVLLLSKRKKEPQVVGSENSRRREPARHGTDSGLRKKVAQETSRSDTEYRDRLSDTGRRCPDREAEG